MRVKEQAAGLAEITFLTGPLAGQTFQITKPTTTIGRDSKNDLVIKGDLTISRNHACLRWNAREWTIENRSEGNALLVNGQSIQEGLLEDQAIVGLGGFTTFRLTIQPLAQHEQDETLPGRSREGAQTPHVDAPTLPQGTAEAIADLEALVRVMPPSSGPVEVPRAETGLLPRTSQTLVGIAPLMGIPTLEVSSNTGAMRRSYPLDKPSINLGRDANNDIVIADPTISAQHLQLVREGQHFVLFHPPPQRQRTTNGLLAQGRKIRGDEAYHASLVNGDVFRIGDESGTLITLVYHDGSGASQEVAPPVRPITLGEAEYTIGRKPENTIVLPHQLVSSQHAKLVREVGSYRILDLHSTNHVYVNGQLVTSHLLKLGDEMRIGPYRLIYESTQITQYDESAAIRIDGLNLKKYGAKRETLLNNIS